MGSKIHGPWDSNQNSHILTGFEMGFNWVVSWDLPGFNWDSTGDSNVMSCGYNETYCMLHIFGVLKIGWEMFEVAMCNGKIIELEWWGHVFEPHHDRILRNQRPSHTKSKSSGKDQKVYGTVTKNDKNPPPIPLLSHSSTPMIATRGPSSPPVHLFFGPQDSGLRSLALHRVEHLDPSRVAETLFPISEVSRCPVVTGVPPSHQPLKWDFPLFLPSSYGGTPMSRTCI